MITQIAVASFIILFLLEATARFYYFGLDMFDYTKIKSFHWLLDGNQIRASSNNRIGYELKPNLNSYLKLKKFITNADGLRDQDYSIKKPPNTIRVAVMGSSFTMATGVAIEDTWHSIQEERLNSQPGIKKYEFINFAVESYESSQTLALLKEKALSYEPDLILFCGTENRWLGPLLEKKITWRRRSVKNAFFKSYLYIMLRSAIKRLVNMTFNLRTFSRNYFPNEIKALQDLYRELEVIQKTTQTPIVVVVLGGGPGSLITATRLIKKIAVPYGLPVVNTVIDMSFDEYCVHKLDCHPSPAANKKLANAILSSLNKLGFLL